MLIMKNLVESLIKQSYTFDNGYIQYYSEGNHVVIHNKSAHKQNQLAATDLVVMFGNVDRLSQYVWYNEEEQRIELVVFW